MMLYALLIWGASVSAEYMWIVGITVSKRLKIVGAEAEDCNLAIRE